MAEFVQIAALSGIVSGAETAPTEAEIQQAAEKVGTTVSPETTVTPESTPIPGSEPTDENSTDGCVRKTPTTEIAKTSNVMSEELKTNVLDFYRSYTYNFTLASIGDKSIIDVQQYIESDFFIIAKSGGKGELHSEYKLSGRSADAQSLIDDFNKNSPGKYDFYINNVKLDSIMAPTPKTGFTVSSNIEFDIFEPYSIGGFFDALQVAASSAGYANYVNCPFIFKIEFVGYRDGENALYRGPEVVPSTTRYIAINMISADCELTELGCTYRCKAVPVSERSKSHAGILKSAMKLRGTTVGEVLTDFETQLNSQLAAAARAETDTSTPQANDVYEIEYVELDTTTNMLKVVDKNDSKIAKCSLVEFLKSKSVENHASGSATIQSSDTTPGTNVIQFSENTQIHDAISSIIRDSDYSNELMLSGKEWVQSFLVISSTTPVSNGEDNVNAAKGAPKLKHRFSVVQHEVHASLTNVTSTAAVTVDDADSRSSRIYNYLYTGKNTSVLSFNLKFNMLFYQAIVPNGGNTDATSTKFGVGIPDDAKTETLVKGSGEVTSNSIPAKSSPEVGGVNVRNMPNTSNPNVNFNQMYDRLLNSSVDRFVGEIKIVGDPYYVSSDLSDKLFFLRNDSSSAGATGGTTGLARQLCVAIRFSTINDVTPLQSPTFGRHQFNGLYRVIKVMSEFTDGVFSQTLKIVKIANEDAVTKIPEIGVVEKPDPNNVATPEPSADPVEVATSDSVAGVEVTPGIAVALPPGIASGVSSAISGAQSAVAGVQSVGAAANAAAGSVLGKINSAVSNVTSSITGIFKTATSTGTSAITTAINSQA